MKYIKKNPYIMRFAVLTGFFAALTVSFAGAEDTCIECHKDVRFRTQNPVLFDYYKNWKDSVHEIEGVTCTDCHGGNSDEHDKKAAHSGDFSSLTSIDSASFKKIPERCGECHYKILMIFEESDHYKTLIEKGSGPNCSTCHGSVNANVYYTSVISRACEDCHNEYTENRPDIAGEADKILHRINVSRTLKRWIFINYGDDPAKVEEIQALYRDIAESWHRFDFKALDQKSQDLVHKLKSLLNRGQAEKRKRMKKK